MGILEKMMTGEIPKVIYIEKSPIINATAYVQEDSRCAYLYLVANANTPNSITNCCWLRNFKSAPKNNDKTAEKRGLEQMQYKEACNHPKGTERFDNEWLSITWLEEGCGVALYYKSELVAVIPTLDRNRIYNGYSKESLIETEIAKPLTSYENLDGKLEKSYIFWKCWTENKWKDIKEQYITVLDNIFDCESKEYDIENNSWHPKSVIVYDKGVIVYLVTLGVSIIPQPLVENDNYDKYKRIELIFPVSKRYYEAHKKNIIEAISKVSTYPWKYIKLIKSGNIIETPMIKQCNMRTEKTLLLDSEECEEIPDLKIGKFRDDEIKLLWMVPISNEFYEIINVFGYKNVIEKCDKSKDFYIFNG